jgi:hypothetical protein
MKRNVLFIRKLRRRNQAPEKRDLGVTSAKIICFFWENFSYFCFANNQSMANPNGKKGSPLHQEVQGIELIKTKVEFENQSNVETKIETPIFTPKGKKRERVADVAAYTTDEVPPRYLKIIQIGKTDKDGKPVKREQEAIDDIEQHTGLKVVFIDYTNYFEQ